MTCKHNRIIKQMVLTIDDTKDITKQYKDVYVCSHCGCVMKCEPEV